MENCLFKGLRGTAKGSSSRAIYEEIGLLKKDEEFFSPAYLYSSSTGDKTIYAYKDLRKLEEELTQTSPSDKWRIKELVFALTECAKIKKDFKNPPPVTKMARFFKTPVGWSDYFAKEKIFGGTSIEEWAHSFSSLEIQNFLLDLIEPKASRFYYLLSYADFIKGDSQLPRRTSKDLAKGLEEKFLSLGGEIKFDMPIARAFIDHGAIASLYSNSHELKRRCRCLRHRPFLAFP